MMKFFLTVLMLIISLALVPFAVDWRSPFLVDMRPWLLTGLIVLPLILILAEVGLLRSSRPEQWLLRSLGSLGLLAAVLALTTVLALETRFHWVRHQVLHAEPSRLEKLGRHLIVGYRDLAEVRELVSLRAIAGVFIASHNVQGKSIPQIRQEIQSLQNARQREGLPRLWIATDQEGGIVSRLSPPLTCLPALSEIVERYSDMDQLQQAVREFSATQGRELADLGVNLNFAPMVDLNYHVINPNDRYTRIFQRAISSDPAVVARVAAWYCAALEDAGVRCTLKHFPGLGRVFEDTHRDHANLTTSLAELSNTDWVPFRALMSQSGAFTMLGHVRLTAIDGDRPVSMSAPVIAGLIRGEWKHDGVLITDNFSMLAVYRSSAGIDNGSIEALNAGVDLILVSYDPDHYYRVMYALLKADRQESLDREALRRSDQRLAHAIRSMRH
jgi:beta-N-acetylhexosaminidase